MDIDAKSQKISKKINDLKRFMMNIDWSKISDEQKKGCLNTFYIHKDIQELAEYAKKLQKENREWTLIKK